MSLDAAALKAVAQNAAEEIAANARERGVESLETRARPALTESSCPRVQTALRKDEGSIQ